ncbi:cytochrome P450 2K1-like isoform 2-T2 [Mantella aurantiaca]
MLITMDLGFSVVTYVVLALTILYVFNNLWKWDKGNIKNFPPGPRGLPFIGNLHIMDLKKPHFTYLELAKKYGPVFSVQMGLKKIVVLAGYETVKDALVNYAEEFGGRGKTRMFQNMDKEFGKPFDNMITINSAVANIIVSVLLGHRMDYEDRQFKRLLSLTSENFRLLGSLMVGIYNIFPFLGFLPGSHKTVIKNVEEMCEYITQTFIKHLKNLDENDQRSFIDAFLVRQKEEAGNLNSYFHNENLTRLVRNLFAAGMETTSTTLRWGLLLMMKFPAIQEKVQEEITKVIGLAQPMYSHRVQMPYTNAVIHEIQRFADIVPLSVPHETTRDVTFKGYFIPKETYVIPLLSSVLRDKTQFENPDEFYPNHFLDSHGKFIKKDAFMPFSAGRRACAGENLARMELFIFFANMLQKFTFSFPLGVNESDLLPGVGFTNLPKQYLMCAVPRY